MGLSVRRWPDARLGAALSLLLMGSGVAASVMVGGALVADARAAGEQLMDRRAGLVNDVVVSRVARYVDATTLVAAGIGAQPEPSASGFRTATAPLTRMGLAGATSIAFVPPAVGDAARGSHLVVAFSRRLGDADPLHAGLDVGQDVGRATAPYTALLQARERGVATISDAYQVPVDLGLPEDRRQQSFTLVVPSSGPDAQGDAAFKGWVVLGVRGGDFLTRVLERAIRGLGIDVELLAQDAERQPVPLARVTGGHGPRELQRTFTVPVAQRVWTLRVSGPRDQLGAPATSGGRLVQVGGSLLSVLLGGLLLSLVTSRAHARAQVVAATADLRAAEAEARAESALLQCILDSTSEAVGVVDADGAFILHNPAARQLLGVEDDRDGAEHWHGHYGIFTPDGSRPFPVEELPLVRAINGESTDGVEMLIRNAARPDGVLISVSGRPLDPASGRSGGVAAFRDITEERAREAELVAFAGMVAHDLRNPLGLITGYGALLRRSVLPRVAAGEPGAAAEADGQLETIEQVAGQMLDLIQDLLNYTTAEHATLDLQDVELRELAEEVTGLHVDRLTVPSDQRDGQPPRPVPQCYVGDLPVVRADRTRVRQLLDNLVGNAIKYTPPDRPARVDLTSAGTAADGLVRIAVADRGLGIPEGQHAKVFQRFYRVPEHAAHPGSGLGLAICHRIVELHGGTITAEENPGGGTLVVFTLPAGERPPVPPRVADGRAELVGEEPVVAS